MNNHPFLDTNVFLRHILNDDPQKSNASLKLFQNIEQGKLTVWTSNLVIAEIVFILSNKKTYNLERETIRNALLPLINLTNIKLQYKQLYPRIFEIYVQIPIDYIDAYHAALIEKQQTKNLLNYDTDFDKLNTLTRQEP